MGFVLGKKWVDCVFTIQRGQDKKDEKEIGGQGEKETMGQGDKLKKGKGDKEKR